MEDVYKTVKPILVQAGAPFASDMSLIQLYQSNCDSSNYYKSRQEIASWVSMKKQTKAAMEKARREFFQTSLYPQSV